MTTATRRMVLPSLLAVSLLLGCQAVPGPQALTKATQPTIQAALLEAVPARREALHEGKQKFIVTLTEGADAAQVRGALAAAGAEVLEELPDVGLISVASTDPGFLAKAGEIAGVDGAMADFQAFRLSGSVAAGQPNTAELLPPGSEPRTMNLLWNMQQIGADRLEAENVLGSPQVTVAVLDTGIDFDNPEFAQNLDLVRSRSVIDYGADAPVGVLDLHGHGSHVAGIIGANQNGFGVVGVAPKTTLMAVKVLDHTGYGDNFGIMRGIVYAADAGADVINMSIEDRFPVSSKEAKVMTKGFRAAIDYATRKGAFVVSATGNYGENADTSGNVYLPVGAGSQNVGVSATGPVNQQNPDAPAIYSVYGEKVVSLAAPGGGIAFDPTIGMYPADMRDLVLSTWSTHTIPHSIMGIPVGPTPFMYLVGTSQAAPHVAGAAALVMAKYPGIDPRQVRRILFQTADDLGAPGFDAHYGHGRLNAYRAIHEGRHHGR